MFDRNVRAEQFLKSCKANLKIECCCQEKDTCIEALEYRYIITRKGKQLSGTFSKKPNENPNAYDVLSSLPNYEPELDLWDFARNHGYRIECQHDYDTVSCAYKEYCHNWRGVNRLFGDVLDEFWESL